ncbi:hypothetical protein Ddye_014575 [Dipteronia dyeriana]|uniref:Uncharacterized protein n=1 Tax=Dipteronia dyeriana TaxID=168575 RepID=A0AAD9X8F4_9ROSI|nr:hypothetical protein Ddye_014575 [Dipteronia dyeriana]
MWTPSAYLGFSRPKFPQGVTLCSARKPRPMLMMAAQKLVGHTLVRLAAKVGAIRETLTMLSKGCYRKFLPSTNNMINKRSWDTLPNMYAHSDNTRFAAKGIYENLMATGYIDLTEEYGLR